MSVSQNYPIVLELIEGKSCKIIHSIIVRSNTMLYDKLISYAFKWNSSNVKITADMF